jgi:hypothetical protein
VTEEPASDRVLLALALLQELLDEDIPLNEAYAATVASFPGEAKVLSESIVVRASPEPSSSDRPIEELVASVSRRVAARTRPAPISGLYSMIEQAELEMEAFLKELKIGKSVLYKLERRLIEPATVPSALLDLLADSFSLPIDSVLEYLSLPPTLSYSSSFKGSSPPTARPKQTFESALWTSISVDGINRADYDYWISRANAPNSEGG